MNRRNFLAMIGLGGVSAAVGALFSKVTQLPEDKVLPYVNPPEDVIPGVPAFYNTLCSGCSAGCGITVKTIEHRVKKIEGNKNHPINQGGLCSLGQALPQALYNPDRIMKPLKLSGDRGTGKYTEISWEEAIKEVSSRLSEIKADGKGSAVHMLTSPLTGSMDSLASKLMASIGSSNRTEYELFQNQNLIQANKDVFGIDTIPYYDIENSELVLSFGSDFLSSGVSPVNHSMSYGKMRQGKDSHGKGDAKRGRLVSIEPRMTLTGANADSWVPAKPGTEGLVALSIAAEIVNAGGYSGADKSAWQSTLAPYRADQVGPIADVEAKVITALASEVMEAGSVVAIGGQTLSSYENGVAGLAAVNVLNHIAGATGKKGGLIANPNGNGLKKSPSGNISEFSKNASAGKVAALLHYGANPLFSTPGDIISKEEFDKINYIVSFSSFMDETTVMADIILPAHHSLEDWGDDFTAPGVGYSISTIQQPTTPAQFDTRSMGDSFMAIAKNLGSSQLVEESYAEYVQNTWRRLYNSNNEMSASAKDFDTFWTELLKKGGWWVERKASSSFPKASATGVADILPRGQAGFEGDAGFPLYMVLQSGDGVMDGRGANSPWLQEKPDPLTTAVWGTTVEINPKAASKFGIKHGDLVKVSSPVGSIEAPAYLFEGVRPDTVSISIGNGHTNYGGYADGSRVHFTRLNCEEKQGTTGVNPLHIIPSKSDKNSGEVLINTAKVKVEKVSDKGHMVTMEGTPKELGRGIVQVVTVEELKRGSSGGHSGGHH